jgi:hypothetical protein
MGISIEEEDSKNEKQIQNKASMNFTFVSPSFTHNFYSQKEERHFYGLSRW